MTAAGWRHVTGPAGCYESAVVGDEPVAAWLGTWAAPTEEAERDWRSRRRLLLRRADSLPDDAPDFVPPDDRWKPRPRY